MTRRLITTVALAASPTALLAHGGADGGAHHLIETALGHPFSETEHLLAMLAVGVVVALVAWRVVAAVRRSRREAQQRAQAEAGSRGR
ncbi:HupE/UreJ family protein [Caldimonas sp. KR1-144]|uniref:HupE/UreJ family protein n=1 Tax=Caldimonas sp. KR1-144 TaxID=3400911 RepID=UPI003C0990A5